MTQLEAEMHHSWIIRLFNNTNVSRLMSKIPLIAEKRKKYIPVKQRIIDSFSAFFSYAPFLLFI